MNGTSKSKSQHNLNQVKQNRLVLINDDFNTFDHVVDFLLLNQPVMLLLQVKLRLQINLM